MEQDARRSGLNPFALDALLEEAQEQKKLWGCPCVGNREPSSSDQLDSAHQQALKRVEDLTGVKDIHTCPYSYLLDAHIREYERAWKWWDKGQLNLLTGDKPLAHIIEAVDIIDSGLEKMKASEYELIRKEGATKSDQSDKPTINRNYDEE